MSAARLRVGVPAELTRLPSTTSSGRIWDHGLSQLRGHVDIVPVERPGSRRWRRPVDVWLTDGHQGPLEVDRPVVAHLHEASWADPELRPHFEPWFLECYELASQRAAQAAAQIITVSASSARQIQTAYGTEPCRIVVAHNGVDHAVYRPDRTGAAELVTAAGGDGGRPYVLFVSSVHPRKNLGALRQAMAGLARRGHPHALVLVAGPAADRADSAELSAAARAPIDGIGAPVVNLAGADDASVAALMAGADAFCLPSLMEGFGMGAAEALACGSPVVVSDRGSLPEVVGDAGIVVAPDAASVEAGLASVLEDPVRAATLRAAGPVFAARYTWSAMADQWQRALVRAVG